MGHGKRWHGGATCKVLDMRSIGRGFKSYLGQKLCYNFGQVVHTYVPLSPSSITLYMMLYHQCHHATPVTADDVSQPQMVLPLIFFHALVMNL